MKYQLQTLADLPALILTINHDYDLARDFQYSYADVNHILNNTDEPLFYIMDLTQATLDMNLILDGVKRTSVDETGNFRHPMTRGVIFVSPDPVVGPVANGLSHQAFGELDVYVTSSLEDALDYVAQAG